MTKLQMFLDLFSGPKYRGGYTIAKAPSTCILCGKPVREFQDDFARLEYSVSALCQGCQDECFNGTVGLATY